MCYEVGSNVAKDLSAVPATESSDAPQLFASTFVVYDKYVRSGTYYL